VRTQVHDPRQVLVSKSAPIRICLLGGFGIASASRAIPASLGKRQQTLVAYLLLHRRTPHDRKHLAFLLWPDSAERQALTNLRQLIHDVRAVLPDPDQFIEAGRQQVRWRSEAPCTVDVDEFETGIAVSFNGPAGQEAEFIAALSSAVERYTGDLLPDCYDEWIEPERHRLRRALAGALGRLVQALEARREYGTALRHARRLLDLDPLNEGHLMAVMRMAAADGQRAVALEAYQQAEERFRLELGVAPSEGLKEFRDRLRHAGPEVEATADGGRPALAFFNRAREWGALTQAWQAGRRTPPRCVMVSGVAGIGKSRLAEEFVRWAHRQGAAVATSACYGMVGRLPYAPLVDWLRSPALHTAMSRLPDPWRGEIAALLPELGPSTSPSSFPAGRSQLAARRRLFEALLRAFTAAPEPLLLVLDDIQWADRETLEWIHLFLQAAGPRWVLVLMLLRAGEVPLEEGLDRILLGLRSEGLLEEIALGPLDVPGTAALGAAALGRPLDADDARALHEETEGHPLYIVEMSRAIATGAHRPIGPGEDRHAPTRQTARRSLPQGVLAVIEARLAQLSRSTSQVLGVASVIGREFRLELVADCSEMSQDTVLAALDELLERRLVRELEGGTYTFSHDSIREVTYGGLSNARRQILHHRVARSQMALAVGSSSSAAAIARHLEQAGLLEGAIPYYRVAAQHALALCAGSEAVLHLEKAIELVKRVPESAPRQVQEIELRTALCVALIGLEMYSGPRMLQEYERVRTLCESAGMTPGPAALRTLALALIMTGEIAEAEDIGRRLLASAGTGANPVLSVEARYVLGIAAYWQGDPAGAVAHLGAAITSYRTERAPEHLDTFGQVNCSRSRYHLAEL